MIKQWPNGNLDQLVLVSVFMTVLNLIINNFRDQ